MNLAIIPARGGSKRIPRKNIKEFVGKPVIAWSIEAAIKSDCFDKVIVSTDDDEIAEIANEWGAEVPFKRPIELSNDYTETRPVIHHAIDWYEQLGEYYTNVCCIYATAPFVTTSDLQNGLKVLINENCDFTFSVTSFPFPIQRAIRITESNRVEMFNPQHFDTRSQDLEEAWHDAGQFYWGTANAWKQEKSLFSQNTVPILIPRHRAQDIDTLEDWIRAEWLFKALEESK